jgi:hypothetical protein
MDEQEIHQKGIVEIKSVYVGWRNPFDMPQMESR